MDAVPCLPEQGGDLRSAVQGLGRDHADDRSDPKHLGARIGITSVLHTWGSAMTHHPHVHMIVPGGGISLDGKSWISCRPGFFLPVRVPSRLFRRLFLEKADRGPQSRPSEVLRRSCHSRRCAGSRGVSGSATPSRMGGLGCEGIIPVCRIGRNTGASLCNDRCVLTGRKRARGVDKPN
jgi:hypothetical protein